MSRICSFNSSRLSAHFQPLRLGPALLVVLASSHPGVSQTVPQTSERLRIGVALEGGGALGLAHIGVLRWFEQHHIPVDYLAGTSMGGLVGGLYVTGKSPDEIERIVKGIDWPSTIAGTTPFASGRGEIQSLASVFPRSGRMDRIRGSAECTLARSRGYSSIC